MNYKIVGRQNGGIKTFYNVYWQRTVNIRIKPGTPCIHICFDSAQVFRLILLSLLGDVEYHIHGNELLWQKYNGRIFVIRFIKMSLLKLALLYCRKVEIPILSVSKAVPEFYQKFYRIKFDYELIRLNEQSPAVKGNSTDKSILLVGGQETIKRIGLFDVEYAAGLLQANYSITYVGYRSLYDEIECHGRVEHDKLLEIMGNHAALVIMSRTEGMPIIIYEALEKGMRVFNLKSAQLDFTPRSYEFTDLDDLKRLLCEK